MPLNLQATTPKITTVILARCYFLPSDAPSVEYIVDGLFLKHRLGREVMVKDPSAVEPVAKEFAAGIEEQFGPRQPKFSLTAYLTTGKK